MGSIVGKVTGRADLGDPTIICTTQATQLATTSPPQKFYLSEIYLNRLKTGKLAYVVNNGKVYLWTKIRATPQLKRIYSIHIKTENCNSPYKKLMLQLHRPRGSLSKNLNWHLLTIEGAKHVLEASYAGDLIPFTVREYNRDIRKDVEMLVKFLTSQDELSVSERTLLDQLTRWLFISKFQRFQNRPPGFDCKDPNSSPFELPAGLAAVDLNRDVQNAVPFDTSLTCPVTRKGEIVGYGAYDIELEPEHTDEEVAEVPTCKPKLSEAQKRKVRESIAKRFATRYHYSEEEMTPFKAWADVVEQGYHEFLDVSTNSTDGNLMVENL